MNDLAALALEAARRLLTPTEASALADALAHPWDAAHRRQSARTAALTAALAATAERTPYAAACAVERGLRARAAGHPIASNDLQAACDAVLAANRGRPLGWRQMLRTTPALCHHDCSDDKAECGI